MYTKKAENNISKKACKKGRECTYIKVYTENILSLKQEVDMKVYDTETRVDNNDTYICSPNLEENPPKEDENPPKEDDYLYPESSNCSTIPEEIAQRLDNLRVDPYSYRTVS